MNNGITVLSFDVDRTLVDRRRSSHAIADRVRETLIELNAKANIRVVLNTGRDLTSLAAFDLQVGTELDALFLSGRGARLGGEISINPGAVLSMKLIESCMASAKKLEIPFLDIKTRRGTIQVHIMDNDLPFGFQKPRDWFQDVHVERLKASSEDLFQEIDSLQPARLEVPVTKNILDKLIVEIGLPDSLYSNVLPAHPDYLNQSVTQSGDVWSVLQIMSSTEQHNKGLALKQLCDRLPSASNVVHFGDSDCGHNIDSIVTQLIPNARYIPIDWNASTAEEVERLLVAYTLDCVDVG